MLEFLIEHPASDDELLALYREAGCTIPLELGSRPEALITVFETQRSPILEDGQESSPVEVLHTDGESLGLLAQAIEYPIEIALMKEGELVRRLNYRGWLEYFQDEGYRSDLGLQGLGPVIAG